MPFCFAAALQAAGPNIVATTPDLGAIAKAVAGDAGNVTALARPTEDPHFVDAKPSFIRALGKADILLESGAQLEIAWLPALVDRAKNPGIAPGKPGRFLASENVDLCDDHDTPDGKAPDHVHVAGNPHFLLDPKNAVTVATHLGERLAAIDPAGAAGYRERAAAFKKEIEAKLPEWKKRLAPLKGAKITVWHETFEYFFHAFDFAEAGCIEPKPGVEPSSAHLIALINAMKKDGVKIILAETFRPTRTCKRVADESGATLVRVPLMPGGVAGTGSYPAMIEYYVGALEKLNFSDAKTPNLETPNSK